MCKAVTQKSTMQRHELERAEFRFLDVIFNNRKIIIFHHVSGYFRIAYNYILGENGDELKNTKKKATNRQTSNLE